MAKNAFPSIFYVYGNKTFEEDIKAYLMANFNTLPLNLSSSTGCGFKIESHDIGDLKRLDIVLEAYEGWIQQTRRTEFNDLEVNLLDLDKFIAGCDNRISTESRHYVNMAINTHIPSVVCVRSLNYLGSAVAGSYTIQLGDVTIKNSVPINGTVTDGRVYRRTLTDTWSFDLNVTDCTLNNALIEFKGSENQSEWIYSNPLPAFPLAGTEIVDKDLDTYKVIDWDNYPRCVINKALGQVKTWAFNIQIVGTSGKTFEFMDGACYAFNANTGDIELEFSDQLNAQQAVLSENVAYTFIVQVNKNCTQLRFAINCIEEPFPTYQPLVGEEFRFHEMIIKNA